MKNFLCDIDMEAWGGAMGYLRHMSAFQIIVWSFAGLVMAGTLLLMLPFASAGPGGAGFWDALFTAVSAACVTGLVVQDTGTYWTFFGQFVILALIQIGGMGVVTIAIMIAVLSGKHIGLMQRSTLQEAVSAPQLGGIVQVLQVIVRWTVIFESAGAAVMAPVFIQQFGWAKGIWFSLFHSISAFCNAGFDLTGVLMPGSSLIFYAENPVINAVIMMLIIAGGLGFITWADLLMNGFHFRRYRMQTKMILTMTAGLIVAPAVLFYFFDFAGLPNGPRFWASLFQSVTARTAGYNSVDLTLMTEGGRMVLILLMMIGASPGSTAGGIKTTTFFTLMATAAATFRMKKDVECFGRRIAPVSIRHSLTVLLLYVGLLSAGSLFITYADGFPILDSAFESASAIATVGLTVGVTAESSEASRYVLMLLMFFGRVGGITLIYAMHKDAGHNYVRLPEEKISI